MALHSGKFSEEPAGEIDEMDALIDEFATAGKDGIGAPLAIVAHASTVAVAGASPSLGPGNPLGPQVWTVPPPVHPGGADEGVNAFLDGIVSALREMRERGVRPAALLVDTVFSSDGVCGERPGFLAQAADIVRSYGGLFIADEVQAGFGRTGESLWGFLRHGVVPDLVTLGKPIIDITSS